MFRCAVCGKDHEGLPPEEAPERDPEKLAALKSAWYIADERAKRDRPRTLMPTIDSHYLQGKAAMSWVGFALEHLKEGRVDHAWAALETAAKRWERRKLLGSTEEWDRRHAIVERACMAYLVASRRTGVVRIPETLTTGNDGSYFLRCTEPCVSQRPDGLRAGQVFYVVQLFNQEGYYTSVKAASLKAVREKAASRTALKGFTACTVPFQGKWIGGLMDVSTPADYKETLAEVDRPSGGDD